MKKLLLLMMSVATLSLSAQIPDIFTNYFPGAVAGDNLIDYGATGAADPLDEPWALSTKGGYGDGVSPVFSNEDMLFYTGYIGSEKGISVEIDSSNEDDQVTRNYTRGIQIDALGDTLKFNTNDSIYAAFMIKPKAYDFGSMRDIVSFEASSTGNWSRGRVFMDIIDGTDVQFGIGKKNSPVNIGDTAMRFFNGLDQTYLLVLAYQNVDDPVEDAVIKLYINPDCSLGEAAQTNVITCYDTTQSGYSDGTIVKMNICQRGHTAEIGGMRVAKTWTNALTVEPISAVANTQAELAVNVYPNPSNGAITVANVAGADVVIYDVTGKVIQSATGISDAQLFGGLSQGFYFVSVKSAGAQKVTKVIVK